MKKLFVIVALFSVVGAHAQRNRPIFPSIDSMRKFNERYNGSNPADWHRNLRSSQFNQAVLDMLDSARNHWSGRSQADGSGMRGMEQSNLKVATSKLVGVKNIGELKAIYNVSKADTQFVFRFTDYTNRIIKDYQLDVNDSTSKEDGVTVIATASGKRLKIYYENYVLANWWPLDRSGKTDCSASMQKAIDFAINTAQNKRTARVLVLAGVYQVKYLNIWRPSAGGYSFVTATIEGVAPTYDVTASLSPTTTFKTIDGNAYTINVQLGRNCVIRNIAFWGPATAPPTLGEVISWTDGQWTKGCRNNAQSPQAAIVTDAYHGSVKDADQYPGRSANYVGSGGSGTSGLKIEYCAIYNHLNAVMVSPNQFTQNGDNIILQHSYVGLCRSVWSTGQPQSRGNLMYDVYSLGQVKYLINGFEYGLGNGAPPSIDHCNTAGVHKYLYHFFGNLAGLDATDSHFEMVWSLGRSGMRPVNFTNCYLEFVDFGTIAFQPAVTAQGTQINFNGGAISWNDNIGKMGFMFANTQGVHLNGTWLYGSIVLNTSLYNKGLSKYNYARIYSSGSVVDEAMTIGPGATITSWNGKHVLPGMKFQFGESNLTTEVRGSKEERASFEARPITLESATKTAYFLSAKAWMYQINDLLVTEEDVDDATDIYNPGRTIIGMITAIKKDTVRMKFVSSAITSGKSYQIGINRIPQLFSATIGDIDGTETIKNVKCTGGVSFTVGARIKGTGIPAGTWVKQVDLKTGTILLSTKTTATAKSIKLYDADFIQYATIPGLSALTTGAVVRRGDIFFNDFSAPGDPTIYAWVVIENGVVGRTPAPSFKKIPLAKD